MLPLRRLFLAALLVVLIAPGLMARTWRVNVDGSGDAPTIQAAVDSSQAGDEILVGPGTHMVKNTTFKPGVLLRSELGREQTRLRFSGRRPDVMAHCADAGEYRILGISFLASVGCLAGNPPSILGDEGTQLVISDCEFVGLAGIKADVVLVSDSVFRNNVHEHLGGAIWANSVSVVHCYFEGNNAPGDCSERSVSAGGAIAAGDLDVTDSIFLSNRAESWGGAIYISIGIGPYPRNAPPGVARIVRCIFIGNSTGRGWNGNLGDAVYATSHFALEVSECVFALNRHTQLGGALALERAQKVDRCTFFEGQRFQASAVSNSIFENSPGGVSCNLPLSIDPQFCAVDPVASMNFTVQSDSPCAPGNHPEGLDCGQIGAGPVGCGAVIVTSTTWSLVKQLFR